jgi:hypothetical protein
LASSADGCFLIAAVGGRASSPGLIYTWQSIPSPSLVISRTGQAITASWTVPSKTFVLQSNSDLSTSNWVDVPIPPVLNYSNLQYQVSLPLTNQTAFFRLFLR